jgi:hypothetical protein
VLTALCRPASAFGGAGADKIALHVAEAAQHHDSKRPVLVVVPPLKRDTDIN